MSTKAELVKCLYIYPHNAVRCVDIKTTEVDLHRRQRTISKITTVTGKQVRYRSFVHSCIESVCVCVLCKEMGQRALLLIGCSRECEMEGKLAFHCILFYTVLKKLRMQYFFN